MSADVLLLTDSPNIIIRVVYAVNSYQKLNVSNNNQCYAGNDNNKICEKKTK